VRHVAIPSAFLFHRKETQPRSTLFSRIERRDDACRKTHLPAVPSAPGKETPFPPVLPTPQASDRFFVDGEGSEARSTLLVAQHATAFTPFVLGHFLLTLFFD
jgi:hypothetical protein